MKDEKKNPSAKRRIEEARARGAKRFYEWDASTDREWLRAYDKYLDRLAGDYGESHDVSLRDKYDQVWVHGYTEEIPLVVLEGDKKYLASYEYEVAGKIDTEAEEVFQLTDALEFTTFDLYEFPKDGIPANWNEEDDIIVASISDDAERLNRITVAGGTPVKKALEDQMIKEVEQAYYNEDVEELKNRIVDQCIQQVSPNCIEILTMFYYKDMSLDEILEQRKDKNSSKNGLKTAKNKCMNTLRGLITTEFKKYNFKT